MEQTLNLYISIKFLDDLPTRHSNYVSIYQNTYQISIYIAT